MAERSSAPDPKRRPLTRRRTAETRLTDVQGSRKRRPPGVNPSSEQKRLIISTLEAGGSVDGAARGAGSGPRTFRELRQRARGRHPTCSALPHLKPFFAEVDQAIGRRLLSHEIWASDHDPKFSLKYLRSRLESEDEDEEPVRVPTAEEMHQELDVLISSRALRVPQCQDPNCSCVYHRQEGVAHDDESRSRPDR
jgi:hypothetical protein